MTRPLREARIDLGAIRSNVALLKEAVTPAAAMVVVKAGGYGHGAEEVARAAVDGGADWLGVVDVEEALALRASGIESPILAWLHGTETDFVPAIAAGIDLGISTLNQLDRVAEAAGTAFIHLKVDTGLGRNGFEERTCADAFSKAARLEKAGKVHVVGMFSHLANAGENEDAEQVRRFEQLLVLAADAGLEIELRHLASTAAALRLPSARFDLVRLGIGAYGLSPFEGQTSLSLGLRPAMELSAAIAAVKRVPAGSGVSYGYTYRTGASDGVATAEPQAEGESTLALIPLGYADGIPRHASSRGPVWINGRTYRVSGRIAMDQFVVDLGADDAIIGDRAVLFGDPGIADDGGTPSRPGGGAPGFPSADDWAVAADTINYEIVTRIGPRVTRTYLP